MKLIMTFITALSITAGAHAASFDAQAIATEEYATLRNAMCPLPDAAPAASSDQPLAVAPMQVFDNFYFLGHRTTSAWALTTAEGIILFEAMAVDNVEETVVAGLRQLGLDPAAIEYAIISHGHNDHFGGARHLQQTYGAHIVMSAVDWEHMRSWPQRGTPAPFPEQDIAVNDGDTITLGDTTVRMIVTPGHTPGTLSPVFPVRDRGTTHLVGYWGGAAVSFLPAEGIEQYLASARRYAGIDPGIDVELSNHAFVDGSLMKMQALAGRETGDAHPFVTGQAGFQRWMNTIIDCAEEVLAQKQAQQ